MPDRFSQVSENVYRGGEPSSQDLDILSHIFDIQTIISLDGKIGDNIDPLVKKLGMKHIIIPVTGHDGLDILRYFKNNIAKLIKENEPVYVHCRHGKDRTGMAIALYRISNGWSPKKALKEAYMFDFGKKLDNHTKQLYTDVILNKNIDSNDSLDDTITGIMRDNFDQGNVPPAFAPRMTFAPYENIPMQGYDGNMPFDGGVPGETISPRLTDPQTPSTYLEPFPYSDLERKRELARLYLQRVMPSSQIPLSGHYEQPPYGLEGVGPVEPRFYSIVP